MQNQPSTLGQRVAALRGAANIPARALSLGIGASHSVVAQLEAGSILSLRFGLLRQLARALGTTAEYLDSGEGEPPTDEQVRAAWEAFEGERKAKEQAA